MEIPGVFAGGCGKTTLLRCIAGLEPVSKGLININGTEIKAPGTDRMMVFQDFNQLFPWLNVRNNIIFPLKVAGRGQNDKERKQLADYYLELVGMNDYINLYPYQLSGGMKQRTAIARALALNPKVLLMDEPFGSLDAVTRTDLQEELLKIWEETKVTIIFVTHNIEEALLLTNRIIVMKSGRIEKIMQNSIPRPRHYNMREFICMWEELRELLTGKDSKVKTVRKIKKEAELAF
ncbi:MAG TPA: ABC transporter ATP-binding protein [Thermoanaerobacterales bacterium]|nr:ABC transporter ATP-binding protein [Thermoanaerobacterales bacterium]